MTLTASSTWFSSTFSRATRTASSSISMPRISRLPSRAPQIEKDTRTAAHVQDLLLFRMFPKDTFPSASCKTTSSHVPVPKAIPGSISINQLIFLRRIFFPGRLYHDAIRYFSRRRTLSHLSFQSPSSTMFSVTVRLPRSACCRIRLPADVFAAPKYHP